jgi:hypothetical protein
MGKKNELALALLSRDRYTPAPFTLRTALHDAIAGDTRPHVYVADAGYPKSLLQEMTTAAELAGAEIEIIGVGRFANTNHAWNELLPKITQDRILCLENDAIIQSGCLAGLLTGMAAGPYSIAVPTVFESDGTTPHFRPKVAAIDHLEGHGVRVTLDRGRIDDTRTTSQARDIQIFERHGFLITRTAALSLGNWDELMFCRTDLDLSLLCDSAALKITFIPTAQVQLADESLKFPDVPFFDYRWDVHRVQKSHERLITKWQLTGYKHTYTHVYDARKRLQEDFGI